MIGVGLQPTPRNLPASAGSSLIFYKVFILKVLLLLSPKEVIKILYAQMQTTFSALSYKCPGKFIWKSLDCLHGVSLRRAGDLSIE